MSPSTGELPVSFHDAVARMRAFLKANGRPEAIVWVKPDDLIAKGSRLHVCVRAPTQRWMDAQVRYELGLDRKMGVVLRQVCQAPGLSCCYVDIPKSAADATQRSLDGSLSFSCTPGVRHATAVTNRLRWSWLKMAGRQGPLEQAT